MVISKRLLDSFPVMLAIVGTGFTSTLAVSKFIGRLQQDVQDLQRGQKDLNDTKYTLAAASEQALRMAIENPGMRVPDPRDASRIIVVDVAKVTPGGIHQ